MDAHLTVKTKRPILALVDRKPRKASCTFFVLSVSVFQVTWVECKSETKKNQHKNVRYIGRFVKIQKIPFSSPTCTCVCGCLWEKAKGGALRHAGVLVMLWSGLTLRMHTRYMQERKSFVQPHRGLWNSLQSDSSGHQG